ncbi:MAG: type II toxin-antitoxin system RelE/ParE family toxin [Chitinophagales bacterium]|nr:type II toxin-antitoxin system RelE/ParE family toxin [Chitinophagales bacterium]
MAKEVIWTKRASRSFEKVIDYLDVEWNEKVKAEFIVRTFEGIEIISEFPEIGTSGKKYSRILNNKT